MKDRIRRRGVRLASKGKRAGREEVHGDRVEGDKISVGNLSGNQGVAIGRGAQATIQSGVGSKELSELFSAIYQKIETRSLDPEVEKEEITDQVKRIESEVARGEKAEPVKVDRWLRNLATMAPDIVDVTLATLMSPSAGISMTIQKIAQKVKKELS